MAKATTTRQVTYLGRRAMVKTIYKAGEHGEREFRILHVDEADPQNGGWPAGTVTSRTVIGNALKGTFKTLIAEHAVDEEL